VYVDGVVGGRVVGAKDVRAGIEVAEVDVFGVEGVSVLGNGVEGKIIVESIICWSKR